MIATATNRLGNIETDTLDSAESPLAKTLPAAVILRRRIHRILQLSAVIQKALSAVEEMQEHTSKETIEHARTVTLVATGAILNDVMQPRELPELIAAMEEVKAALLRQLEKKPDHWVRREKLVNYTHSFAAFRNVTETAQTAAIRGKI